MNNINYNIAKTQALLQQALIDLPVGVAYYILKSKTDELRELYYTQAQKEAQEIAAAQVNSAQSQDDVQEEED